MKLYDATQTIIRGMKLVKARGFTSKNWKLRNLSNDGESPLGGGFERESVVIKAGTWVDYTMQETHSGNIHTITYEVAGEKYSKTQIILHKENK